MNGQQGVEGQIWEKTNENMKKVPFCHTRRFFRCLTPFTRLVKEPEPTAILTTYEGLDNLCK